MVSPTNGGSLAITLGGQWVEINVMMKEQAQESNGAK
jgi:hypothetical protein